MLNGTVVSPSWSRLLAVLCAAALCVVVATHNSPARAQPESVAARIEGSWLVTVTTDSGVPPPFPALVTYSAGGALLVTDSSFPPPVGNVYQGTWARAGGRRVAFTFLGFQYDGAGALAGYVRVSETLTLDPSGDSYQGLAAFELLDPDFNVVFSEPNRTEGRRIYAR